MRSPLGVAVVAARDAGLELLRVLADVGETTLVSFCDLRPDPSTRALGPLRVPRTLDLDAVLDDDEVDAVAILAPLRLRGSLVARALDADKHVLVLGAPAQDPAEVAALVAAARSRRRCLFDAYDGELRPSLQRLRRLLDGGALGDVFYLSSVQREVPDPAAGGRLWEMCSAKLALMLGLLRDEPIHVAAWGESYTRGAGELELLHAHLRFATGITAHLELSELEGRRFSQTRVVGSRLSAFVRERDGLGSFKVFATHDDDVTAVAGPLMLELEAGDAVVRATPDAEPLRLAVAAFLDATRRRRPVPLHDPVAVAATVERIRRIATCPEDEPVAEQPSRADVIVLPQTRKRA